MPKTAYAALSKEDAKREFDAVSARYAELKAKNLKLDMSRGKPSKAQLDMTSDLLTVLSEPEQCVSDGLDVRNYGELAGLPAAKKLFAEILGCKPEECFIGGNASLTLMYDLISKAFTHGLKNSDKPWCKLDKVKFLCPAPGYDRHFRITESFGCELITVPMTAEGPDMDMVEELVKDPAVKGIWCVPKYSNPDGVVYSEKTISRFAHLKPAAKDFALMWDNAYCIHEFEGDYVPFPDILSLCREAGNPDMVYEFASTSKITFPGSGVAIMAASENNLRHIRPILATQTIGFDKINQMRHVKYFGSADGIRAHMRRHADILRPKFETVLRVFERELGGCGIAEWTHPRGGYFVSLNTMDDCARRVYRMAKSLGVALTEAGATFPYGCDPRDRNLRIAPSYPELDELATATHALCQCIRHVSAEVLIREKALGSLRE
jgi:DNA-binding transcriptional MocR family regulator